MMFAAGTWPQRLTFLASSVCSEQRLSGGDAALVSAELRPESSQVALSWGWRATSAGVPSVPVVSESS